MSMGVNGDGDFDNIVKISVPIDTSLMAIAYNLILGVRKMAYSDRELIARIVQCEARRRRRQWNESCSKYCSK